MANKYLSKKEFARRVGKSRATVDWHIKKGNLKLKSYTIKVQGLSENDVTKFKEKYCK